MQTQAKPRKPKSPSYRWVVFALLAAAYLLVYFHRLSPAVVALDIMSDLKAGGALMGLLGSAYFYPYALMQLPAGLLSDSWGPRRTISVFFCLAGAASIFFGLAWDISSAILARVLVGLGVSMLFVPTMKTLTRWFSKAEFAFMTGILMAVGGVGALSASTPLAYLSSFLGWRGSFIVIGMLTLVLAGMVWSLVRDTPAELGLPQPDADENAPALEPIGLWQGVRMVLGAGRFWPLAIWFFFVCGIFFSFGGLWGGPYLMQIHGLSKAQAGNVLSMLAWAMILGSPALSYISDKIVVSRKKMLIATAAVLCVVCAALAADPAGIPLWGMYVICFMLSLCASAVVVIAFSSAKELFPMQIAGTAVGLVNLFPFMGGALMQPAVGFILEASGKGPAGYTPGAYQNAFLLYLACAAVGLVSALFTKDTLGRGRNKV